MTGDDFMQHSVTEVGFQDKNAYSKACVITFPKPFATPPVVVANAVWDPAVQGADLGDSFAVTITKVTTTGFEAIAYRVDYLLTWTLENPKPRMGWTQKLLINWIAYPAGNQAVRPGQGVELSTCVGKGDDHALLYRRIETWHQGAVDLAEAGGSTAESRRVSGVRIVTPGIYHVSAGMRFAREDRLHAWGVTRNSHRASERNVINLEQGFVLARTVHRESVMDAGTYTTLSWTGVLEKDDVLRCLVEPQQFRLYQGVAEDRIGFFRAHFLCGS